MRPVIALITCTFCVLMVLDYSKWDAFVDSDEEQTAPPSANTGRPVAAKSAPTMPPKNDAQPEKPVVLDARAAVDKFGSLDVNSISCTLHIEMDRAPRQVPGLLNRFEEPGAKLLSCKMNHPAVFTGDDLVDLTPDQLASVACDESEPLPATVYLSSCLVQGEDLEFLAANGVWFTVQEFMDAVGKLESTVRGKTGWFGSVDTHHVFYEGIMGSADDRYCIGWGS